jgi:hypothetical protein
MLSQMILLVRASGDKKDDDQKMEHDFIHKSDFLSTSLESSAVSASTSVNSIMKHSFTPIMQ